MSPTASVPVLRRSTECGSALARRSELYSRSVDPELARQKASAGRDPSEGLLPNVRQDEGRRGPASDKNETGSALRVI